MRTCVLISMLWVSLSQMASAQPVKSLDFTIHQEYTSKRALGMGNAFTAVADDHSAMFYNPAMLAWRKDGHLRMFVRGGASPESLELFEEIDKAGKSARSRSGASLLGSNYQTLWRPFLLPSPHDRRSLGTTGLGDRLYSGRPITRCGCAPPNWADVERQYVFGFDSGFVLRKKIKLV